jgi:hypothetical protein
LRPAAKVKAAELSHCRLAPVCCIDMLAICRDPFGHLMRTQVTKISKAIFLGHVAI